MKRLLKRFLGFFKKDQSPKVIPMQKDCKCVADTCFFDLSSEETYNPWGIETSYHIPIKCRGKTSKDDALFVSFRKYNKEELNFTIEQMIAVDRSRSIQKLECIFDESDIHIFVPISKKVK